MDARNKVKCILELKQQTEVPAVSGRTAVSVSEERGLVTRPCNSLVTEGAEWMVDGWVKSY